MKLAASGTVPLNSALEKSKPACCGRRARREIQTATYGKYCELVAGAGRGALPHLRLKALQHDRLLVRLGLEGVNLRMPFQHRRPRLALHQLVTLYMQFSVLCTEGQPATQKLSGMLCYSYPAYPASRSSRLTSLSARSPPASPAYNVSGATMRGNKGAVRSDKRIRLGKPGCLSSRFSAG